MVGLRGKNVDARKDADHLLNSRVPQSAPRDVTIVWNRLRACQKYEQL